MVDPEKLAKFKRAGLEKYFDECYGFALFENVGKFGFIVGLGGGGGKVYTKSGDEFKLVGESTMMHASGGWSLGVQVASEIIFFENEESFNKFTNGNFEFEATAKCAVVTVGADSTARTTGISETRGTSGADTEVVKGGYSGGMATFMVLKMGLMVDVSVGGQKFSYKPLAA